MKINIVTLGDMYLGATYEVTTINGNTTTGIFTGIKYSPFDRSYALFFTYPISGDVGHSLSSIAMADLVEPVKV